MSLHGAVKQELMMRLKIFNGYVHCDANDLWNIPPCIRVLVSASTVVRSEFEEPGLDPGEVRTPVPVASMSLDLGDERGLTAAGVVKGRPAELCVLQGCTLSADSSTNTKKKMPIQTRMFEMIDLGR